MTVEFLRESGVQCLSEGGESELIRNLARPDGRDLGPLDSFARDAMTAVLTNPFLIDPLRGDCTASSSEQLLGHFSCGKKKGVGTKNGLSSLTLGEPIPKPEFNLEDTFRKRQIIELLCRRLPDGNGCPIIRGNCSSKQPAAPQGGFTVGSMLGIFASIGKFIHREFLAAWPVFLFFVFGFLLLLLIIKLALANFSIEMTALSKAVIGGLFAAKAVLLLDETPLARRLEHYRRIVAVAVKTVFYGAITLLLGYMERILDALRRVHNFDAAVRYVIDQANLYRLLSGTLGISLVFAIYFALLEIEKRMGEGELWKLFFDSPKTVGDSGRQSSIPIGNGRS